MPYVHLAGGENELTQLVESGTDAILVSYYYVRKHKGEVIRALTPLVEKIRTGQVHVILDSGAFSFFGKKHVDRADLEGYLFEYINFIREYHYLFTACVELDVGSIVGQDVVEEWREFVFGLLTRDIPDLYVIYVWHANDGFKAWEEMCKKYPYVGLGSDNKVKLDFYKKMVRVAQRYGSKIHGFAITRKDPIRNISFYSVDSTTWIMGGKYGATFFFSGQDLVRIDDDKTSRNRWKAKYKKLGFNWALIEADVRSEVNKINAYAWVEYSQWLDKKRKMKVYWRNDCAGKIRAAFDNTHHEQRLSKAQQMLIPWGEAQWRQVMEQANPGNVVGYMDGGSDTPTINAAPERGGKRRREDEAALVERSQKDGWVKSSADKVLASLEAQAEEDWSNGDPLLQQAREETKARIAEMKQVAPELIEKSQRVAGMMNHEEDAPSEVRKRRRKESRYVVNATVIRRGGEDGRDGADAGRDPSVLHADSDSDGGSNGSGDGNALVPYQPVKKTLALTEEDLEVQRKIARQTGFGDTLDAEDLARLVPVRDGLSPAAIEDEQGPVLGLSPQERKLAAKKLLGGLKKGNAMMCNTCYVADTCPMYTRNSTCYFQNQLGLGRVSDRELSAAQMQIANQMLQRAQMMLMMEQLGGGYADKNTTQLLQVAFDMLERTKDLTAEAQLSQMVGRQSEVIDPIVDDTTGEIAPPPEQPQQSVLARLFGLGPEQAVTHTDDVDYENVEGATDAEFEEVDTDDEEK